MAREMTAPQTVPPASLRGHLGVDAMPPGPPKPIAPPPVPVVITAYHDKSFTFVMKTPPASVLIRKAAKIEKGSARPNTEKVGKITRAQAEEIAKAKMPDLTAADLEAAVRTIAGSARSMGVEMEG